jgi:hypothetical protein
MIASVLLDCVPTTTKTERMIHQEFWRPLWAKTKEDDAYLKGLVAQKKTTWDKISFLRNKCKTEVAQATRGYCLTVHKSQGSQWKDVGYVSCPQSRNGEGEFPKQLLYTGLTRASENLVIFRL